MSSIPIITSAAPNTNWLKTIASPPNATLDIVAVHGMNVGNNDDHADNTWVDKSSGTNWLSDFLPDLVPNARILAFQYNANIAFGASVAGIQEQARNMLGCLWSQRKFITSRPIIFISHSLGGIIVKEALATAHHGDGAFATIATFTYGVFFFGVPHRGSALAKSKWVEIAGVILKLWGGQLNRSFLNSIDTGSTYNEMLNTRFEPLLEKYRFYSFCEGLEEKMNGVNLGIIVDKHSAILGLPNLQEIKKFPNRTHRTLCKFASEDEPEWQDVAYYLDHAARSALNTFNYSPNTLKCKEMFKDLTWHMEDPQEQTLSLSEAIERAEALLTEIGTESESNTQYHQREAQVLDLKAGIIPILNWFLFTFFPILGLITTIIFFSGQSGTTRNAIEQKAEEARQAEHQVVEIERETIEDLDSRLHRVLEAHSALQTAMGSNISPLLRELDKTAEQIVGDLHKHYRSRDKAEAVIKAIEMEQRVTKEMSNREFFKHAEKRAKEEKKRMEETPEKGGPCSWC